jgi:hypothetical protein
MYVIVFKAARLQIYRNFHDNLENMFKSKILQSEQRK